MKNCLILIITYRCNMDCDYCHVEKRNSSMTFETAAAAVDEFLDSAGPGARIRFFGGEPLLEYPLVSKIVDYIQTSSRANETLLDLTTNALLLDESKIAFFRETEHMELILSLDGGETVQKKHRHCSGANDSFRWLEQHGRELISMPNVTINKVVSPETSATLAEDFLYIARLGFRRINLLPAYYVEWDDSAILRLRKHLDGVAKIVEIMKEQGRDLEIKNAAVAGDYPLFNSGMVVDTDGSVYDTNLTMHRLIYPNRALLSRGRIGDKRRANSKATPEQAMTQFLPPETIEQTRKIDEVLNWFVGILRG